MKCIIEQFVGKNADDYFGPMLEIGIACFHVGSSAEWLDSIRTNKYILIYEYAQFEPYVGRVSAGRVHCMQFNWNNLQIRVHMQKMKFHGHSFWLSLACSTAYKCCAHAHGRILQAQIPHALYVHMYTSGVGYNNKYML